MRRGLGCLCPSTPLRPQDPPRLLPLTVGGVGQGRTVGCHVCVLRCLLCPVDFRKLFRRRRLPVLRVLGPARATGPSGRVPRRAGQRLRLLARHIARWLRRAGARWLRRTGRRLRLLAQCVLDACAIVASRSEETASIRVASASGSSFTISRTSTLTVHRRQLCLG